MEGKKILFILGAVTIILYVALTTVPKATNTDKTREQLESFLSLDQTDKHQYINNTFTCYQFADTLKRNATRQGFKCHQVYLGSGPVDHVITLFDIAEGLFFVEPQSDKLVNPFTEYPGETFITIWA